MHHLDLSLTDAEASAGRYGRVLGRPDARDPSRAAVVDREPLSLAASFRQDDTAADGLAGIVRSVERATGAGRDAG